MNLLHKVSSRYKKCQTLQSIHESLCSLTIDQKIIFLLIISKILAFIYLFNLKYIEPYGKLQLNTSWLIFHRWDSAFYDRIAALGYIDLSHWAFLPAFPVTIKIISFVVGHTGASTALAGLIFGIAWIPFYHKIATFYTGKDAATYSTLLFAFFPTVYLFTSIGYSEGLWLTSTLAGWYFYINHKHHLSSIMLTISTLTRIPGFVLPMIIIIHQVTKKKLKSAFLYSVPFIALSLWITYGFLQTGELALLAAQQKTVWNPHLNFREIFLAQLIGGSSDIPWNDYSVLMVMAVVLFTYFYIKTLTLDKMLGIYSICLLCLYLSTGYYLSLPRFLPFTFPIWITTKMEKKQIILYLVFCFILTLLLWAQMLNDRWVG